MTEKSLAQVLKEAVEAIDEAGVPEPLREAAFVKVLDHLLGGAAVPSRAPTVAPTASSTEPAGGAGAPNDSDQIAAIARRLLIEPEVAARVFDVDEAGVHIVLQRSKLARAKSEATQQLARLVTAARQAAGLDQEWTSISQIRSVVDSKGVYDGPNFSRHIQALDGDGIRVRGERTRRELKMNDAGFETAGALVKRLAGEA